MVAVLGDRGVLRLRLLLSALKPGIHVPRAGPAAAFGTSVTSAKVAVNGVQLHYQQTGEGDHAVLLLPGMLGSGETDFGPQLKNLNKKLFTVVAWDPRGYGHSRPPDRDFPADFFERDAKDAVDLMKALKFKKVSLLGWSDGAITALIAAAKYPSYIHKMVIWGANAYVTDEDSMIYEGIRDVSKWSERTRKPLEALYGVMDAWYSIGIHCLARLWSARGLSVHSGCAPGLLLEWIWAGNICRHLLPQVQCPTLIVHGEKDPLVPRFHADFIHEHVKGSRLHLMPEGKHNLHLRFADEFNKLAEDFLQ
ncbi:valacyclovir hydrolase isoform X1 [Symphalangus syndactylus]|uniref:valacyclovir hydrolase isoform X1 n=1 Tax=Symphalangus syndactylus TaxID=9590 RepID=UPI00244336D1|nr:valacyclovir hydrolase isoform X1 [Symphalangus syndactylus]